MNYEEVLDKLDKTFIGDLEFKIALTKAVEKQIKKQPLPQIDMRFGRVVSYKCPNCKSDFLGQNEYKFECCENCGQALDWGIVE